ncbi:MAG: hypothetical protein A2138_08500 [Deltaproteobacteria bacterium RBG_16_71_12]|nr:MAG: hypothetical protein A2138_08500 [Deltaproteobacteria bacterium RBG_16_71_12]
MNAAQGAPPVIFGVVLRDLESYRRLVHTLATSSLVASTDFAYTAPIYKGSDKIVAGLAMANGSLEKFDVYYEHALENPGERVRFAKAFAAQYLRRFPASERQDLFLASGDVLKFSFELMTPLALDNPVAALTAIEHTPHDQAVLDALRGGGGVDRAHLRGDLKILLDHILNPRRREVPQVQAAMMEIETDAPVIVELITTGGMPGYLYYVVHPLVQALDGRLVLLPG